MTAAVILRLEADFRLTALKQVRALTNTLPKLSPRDLWDFWLSLVGENDHFYLTKQKGNRTTEKSIRLGLNENGTLAVLCYIQDNMNPIHSWNSLSIMPQLLVFGGWVIKFYKDLTKVKRWVGVHKNGGDKGARTPDPLHAMQVLSQLSYIPTSTLYISQISDVWQTIWRFFWEHNYSFNELKKDLFIRDQHPSTLVLYPFGRITHWLRPPKMNNLYWENGDS